MSIVNSGLLSATFLLSLLNLRIARGLGFPAYCFLPTAYCFMVEAPGIEPGSKGQRRRTLHA